VAVFREIREYRTGL